MKTEETSNVKEDEEVKTRQEKNSAAKKPTNKKSERKFDISKNALDNENSNAQDTCEKDKTAKAKKTKQQRKGEAENSFYFCLQFWNFKHNI